MLNCFLSSQYRIHWNYSFIKLNILIWQFGILLKIYYMYWKCIICIKNVLYLLISQSQSSSIFNAVIFGNNSIFGNNPKRVIKFNDPIKY